jgi:sugar phosphate isomerase/epimerase
MTHPNLGWVLWAGTVGFDSPLADRFAAAARAGYDRVSLSPPEVLHAGAAGVPARTIGAQARDLGLELIVDPVMNWYPDSTLSPSRFAGVSTEDALRLCEDLGAVSLSAIGTGSSDVPLGALAERFAVVCDRARDFGADVHLEFIPFTAIHNIAVAWDIVRAADRPNGGLVFDTWHFFRGDPDFLTLASIPGERIMQVQIDDASATPTGTLREETQRRLLPGDGELDLTGALRALDAIGGLRWIGPEVINPEVSGLPIHDAATLALERSRAVVAAAAMATG